MNNNKAFIKARKTSTKGVGTIEGPLEGAVVAARDVERTFMLGGQPVHALSRVSLDIFPGEMVGLMGRSGSGKTTLLNVLGGLDEPTSGSIFIEGKNIVGLNGKAQTEMRRWKLGFIFQSFGLLPLLSAFENVELPLRIAGIGWRDRDTRAKDALEVVGMGHRLRHRPYELSGGEQQRVAIARAIVHRPALILADEPTAELDSVTAKAIFDLLRDVVAKDKIAIMVATHDRIADSALHRILRIEDGKIVDV